MTHSTIEENAPNEVLLRTLERERCARKQAEELLEQKSRELYLSNRELQQSSIALEKTAQRSKAVFDTAAEGIIIFEGDGHIESLNTAAKGIFGLQGDCEVDNICQLLPEAAFCRQDDKSCFVSNLRELTGANNEISGRRIDGSSVHLEFVVSTFSHGGVSSHSGIVRDLTKRKALEAQLATAQKLESVGQLAAGIAHELNTPIQFVGDNTRFLQESFIAIEAILKKVDEILAEDQGNEAVRRIAQSVQEAYDTFDLSFVREEIPLAIEQTLQGADNVARIVRAMKVFSHPGSKEYQEVDLNSSLESTLTVSKNEWKYCAEVETHFCPDLPKILCLPGELNQAFLNLIVNGAHAIQAKKKDTMGKLTITTRLDNDRIAIDIADSGTGIPLAIQSRIFDPFFTTKGVGKGTGQGLSISYSIVVEMHKGTLTFDTVEGVGTTFHILLPLDPRGPKRGLLKGQS
jgi:PAS domain S-box-containing protein